MAERYRLPAELGGGEVEIESVWFDMTATVTLMADTSMQFRLPKRWLTEIPPPMPAEPEPGAYLIGGVLVVSVDAGEWRAPAIETPGPDGWSVYRFLWPTLWEKLGGPDVDIVPLVAKPVAVQLPWTGESWSVWTDHPGRTHINVPGSSGLWSVPNDLAREMGWALLSAADRAEAGE